MLSDPRPIRPKAREQKFGKQQPIPFDRCDGCQRTAASTVCAICLNCATAVVTQRRKMFPRSEGNQYMARTFGRRFMYPVTAAA